MKIDVTGEAGAYIAPTMASPWRSGSNFESTFGMAMMIPKALLRVTNSAEKVRTHFGKETSTVYKIHVTTTGRRLVKVVHTVQNNMSRAVQWDVAMSHNDQRAVFGSFDGFADEVAEWNVSQNRETTLLPRVRRRFCHRSSEVDLLDYCRHYEVRKGGKEERLVAGNGDFRGPHIELKSAVGGPIQA